MGWEAGIDTIRRCAAEFSPREPCINARLSLEGVLENHCFSDETQLGETAVLGIS